MKKIKKGLLTIAVGASLASTFVLASCGKAKQINYTFDVQGGNSIEATVIAKGEAFTLPTPQRAGYAFEGWYDNAEFSGSAITEVTADADTVFFAKWAKLYTVNLDAAGGSLDTISVSLKSGASVYEAVANLTAKKGDLEFAGWYINDALIASDLVLSDADITLTAKYKQAYSREYYYEKLDKSGYDKVAGDAGSAFLGEKITDKNTKDGFTQVTKDDSVEEITVGEDKNANVIKKYYNRDSYTVTFDTNYPEDAELINETFDETVVYGNKVNIKTDISCDGYMLIGYATSKDGAVVYSVDSIKEVFNADETGIINTEDFSPTEDVTLYAKWVKPYHNMFGGVDNLYVLDKDSDTIYLERNGVYFIGEFFSKDDSFTFYDVNEDILLEGKLNYDDSFSYSSEVRANLSYNLFYNRTLLSYATLYFDQYNGFKYAIVDGEGKQTVFEGKYTRNDDGTFHGVFNETPEYSGSSTAPVFPKEINFKVGKYQSKNAFQVRNEEEADMGEFLIYVLTGNMLDINPNLTFKLDGYGAAALGSNAYYYTLDKETNLITLQNSDGSLAGVLKIIEINGEQGVALYTEAYNHVFTNGDATLTMDGIGNVVYKDSEVEYEGVYKASSTYLGKTILTVVQENGIESKYIISSTKEDEVVKYTFTEVNEYYKEYVYQDASGAYYGPLLATIDETHAELYGFVAKGQFQLVAKGTYTLDPETARYVFTATEYVDIPEDVTVTTSPLDATTVKSITYGIYADKSYEATYWYSYTNKADEVVSFETKYNYYDEEKDEVRDYVTLSFVANRVVFDNKSEGNLRHYEGTCTISGSMYTCTFPEMSLIVEIDKENGTFIMIEKPHTDYLYEDQQILKTEYLDFDKKGNVTYVVVTENTEGETVEKKYEGTMEDTKTTTRAGSPIYEYTYEGGSFKFIRLSNMSGYYFSKYNEKYDKVYRNEATGEVLALDGYGFQAVYTAGENETKAMYTVSEGYITITINSYSFIFDVNDEDKTMEQRGSEAGSYLVLVNQSFECYIELDGHGKATLFKYEDKEKVILDDTATYSIYDNTAIMLKYIVDGEEQAAIYKYTIKTVGSYQYKAFSKESPFGTMQLVDKKDWSILVLDEYGFAEHYSSEGVRTTGTYVLVSDTLMYFFNDAQTEADIYSYDKETGKMLKGNLKLKGYYTADFESLIFTQYGYAIFDGEETAYYSKEDGEIFLYTYDKENPEANRFGFVKSEFGEFDYTVTYNGKTYYMNTGYDIDFKRVEANAAKYPIEMNEEKVYIENLYFAPTGQEFEVEGRVKIGDKYYTVTVTRKKLADGTYEAYFFLGNNRFDIDIKYLGMDEDEESASTYEITGMRFEREFKNYDFLYMVYLYYSWFGVNAINEEDPYGGVKAIMTYDEEGNVTDTYLDSFFTEKAEIVDSNGEILNFKHANFTLNSSNGTLYFLAKTTGSDGIEYTFYMMSVSLGSPFNADGIRVVYITRPQHVETEDGYVLDMQQIVYYLGTNDVTKSTAIGEMYSMTMKKGDVEIPIDTVIYDGNGNRYAVSRVKDEETGLITATKYYKLNFTMEERLDNLAQAVTSATIEEVNATTYYDENNENYVDILADGTMQYLFVDGNFVGYSNLKYDEATKVYSFSVQVDEETTKNYTLEIKDGKMVLTEITGDIEEPKEEEETPDEETKDDDDLGV